MDTAPASPDAAGPGADPAGPGAMPPWQRAYLTACAGVIGFAIAYALCDYGRWPRLTYFPIERAWRLTAGYAGPLPMSYAGTVLWGAGGAACAAAGAWLGCGLARRAVSERWLRLWGGWALAATAYAALYYLWSLWPF